MGLSLRVADFGPLCFFAAYACLLSAGAAHCATYQLPVAPSRKLLLPPWNSSATLDQEADLLGTRFDPDGGG
jgi:hypothetical protein